ncbi:antibiotic biosynthesis monooxygenase family protein [Bacteroidota bacterium]
MFLRFVKVKIRDEHATDFKQYYEDLIRPELQRTPGCLFAALMSSSTEQIEAVSMTIWDTRADAERYERSGVYKSMLDQARPFISDSDEWRMRLHDAEALLERPHADDPEVTSFPIQTGDPDHIPDVPHKQHYYLRVVSARVKPGELYHFIRVYEEEIVPVIESVEGCYTAFLARGHLDPQHVLSITLWESATKARAYENSGLFEEMHELAKPMLSSFSEWRMALDKDRPDEPDSQDLDVSGWQVVSSNEFSTVKAES